MQLVAVSMSDLAVPMLFLQNYKHVGKVVGRYYDSHGQPTEELKSVETRAANGVKLRQKRDSNEKQWPSCNMKWTQSEGERLKAAHAFHACQATGKVAVVSCVGDCMLANKAKWLALHHCYSALGTASKLTRQRSRWRCVVREQSLPTQAVLEDGQWSSHMAVRML